MGGCLRILIGYVLGILTAIFVLPNIVNMPGNEEAEESVKPRSEYNIKTRQGKTVTLYMGMPKDSVIMLLVVTYLNQVHSFIGKSITHSIDKV